VISSLREVQKSGWNIWSNIELTNTAFQLLFEIGPSNTVLSEIEELVLTEEQQSDWVIAGGLLIRIMKLLEADKRRDFFGVIADHISSILKPEQSQYSVSDESKKFEEPIPELTADACIESLLITLLDRRRLGDHKQFRPGSTDHRGESQVVEKDAFKKRLYRQPTSGRHCRIDTRKDLLCSGGQVEREPVHDAANRGQHFVPRCGSGGIVG
jgi:hypothetical protein